MLGVLCALKFGVKILRVFYIFIHFSQDSTHVYTSETILDSKGILSCFHRADVPVGERERE